MTASRRAPCRPDLFRAALLVAAGWFAGMAGAAPVDDHLHFSRRMPRDGLPAAVVYCITEDSRGFLWLGTADGVARYDGYEFRVFRPDPNDPESLSNASVLAIQEDARGNLWMATEGGLDLWHRDTERFTHFHHDPADATSLSDNTTQSLLLDPDGFLWVGTARGGLNRFDPSTGRFERFAPDSGSTGKTVNDPWIRCLFRDRDGLLWIGTGNGGLNCFDPATRTFRFFRHDAVDLRSLSHNRVSAIAEDRAGHLWIATDGGLCRLDPQRQGFDRYPIDQDRPGSLPSQTVTGVLVDREQRIWFGTDGGGFCRLDPDTGRILRHTHSKYADNTVAADAVRAIYEDQRGDFWLGHFPAGISHFDRTSAAFQVFGSVPGEANTMSDDHVLSFWEDPSGDLWVGTDNGGLNHWEARSGRWTSYQHSTRDPRSLGGKSAVSVYRDHQGTLWVGAWAGGLNRFRPEDGSFDRFLPDPSRPDALSDANAWAIVEDHQHQLWIATIGGGIDRFVPETGGFIHHRFDPADPHSLNDDIVSALLVTREGTLWAGTPKGLARWNPAANSWDRFQQRADDPGTLNGHWIFDLVEDADGGIWATTEGGGLNRLDPQTGSWANFRTADGLPSDILRSLMLDDTGVLWIGSNHGLVRFDPRTRNVRVVDENNGLPSAHFPPHARLRLASGDFLFGTTQGFVRFNPHALSTDPRPPPVVLTEFQVFNDRVRPGAAGSLLATSITETRELVIPQRMSVITFRFAALSFRNAARTQYRFRLEGFEQDWRIPGADRRVTYTNLDAGRYRLHVKAANADGAWNEAGTTLLLTIIPPWWRSWWFQAALTLVILGSATAAGWSVSNRRARETVRERELQHERMRALEREQAARALQVLNQQLEERVAQRTAELSGAVKDLETFSYSVAHDLRAPLRALDGFSQALQQDHGSRLDDEGRENLRRIRAASQRMGHLIDDMLMLARVTRVELVRTEVDLGWLAAQIFAELKAETPTRTVALEIAPGLTAWADPNLMRAVLQNLLSNAWKFTSRHPTARIEFGRTIENGHTVFFIRDDGVGFDPEFSHKLFRPFERLHDTHAFPGTGVGLAIVRRIVERHFGRIWAESKPGCGATFYFTLGARPAVV